MAYLKLIRPKQWTKNLLVFASLLFTNGFHRPEAVRGAMLAFVAMCLISSTVYVINDIRDAEKDRNHPKKKNRPIAAGLITPSSAAVVALILFGGAGAILWLLGTLAMATVGAYLAIQILYNAGAKNVAVLDVFLISNGFILRAVLGAAAINALVSPWLLLCTGALALLLGFAKRRSEFVSQGGRSDTRLALAGYSKQSLDAFVIISATAAALCYCLYALNSPTAHKYPALFITSPFVFYGITRYVLLVFVQDEGAEPETLLYKDPHIISSVLLFVIAALVALSGVRVPLLDNQVVSISSHGSESPGVGSYV